MVQIRFIRFKYPEVSPAPEGGCKQLIDPLRQQGSESLLSSGGFKPTVF
jgi:hypothetical protein